MQTRPLLPVSTIVVAEGAVKLDFLRKRTTQQIIDHIYSVMWFTPERGTAHYGVSYKGQYYSKKFHFRIEGDTAIVW